MNGTEVATPPSAQYGYYPNRSRELSKRLQKRTPYYYILESESSQESDDGSDAALSIQGKETDLAKDTSDTDWSSADDHGSVIEYDVVSSKEDGTEHVVSQVIGGVSSSDTDDNMIVSITVLSDGDMVSADSEDSLTTTTDCEMNPIGYFKCAQCQNPNNNPLFRYCKRCYKFRKELFPPRPRRKRPKSILYKKRDVPRNGTFFKTEVKSLPLSNSTHNLNFQSIFVPPSLKNETAVREHDNSIEKITDPSANTVCENSIKTKKDDFNIIKNINRKRPIEPEIQCNAKRMKEDVCSDNSVIKKMQDNKYISQNITAPLGSVHDVSSFSQPIFSSNELETISKATSHPGFSKDDIEMMNSNPEHFSDVESNFSAGKQESVKSGSSSDSDMCIICLAEPKTGVFVHGRIAHICCCYKCSVKVWTKTKRCPICQCKVSNVLKAFIK